MERRKARGIAQRVKLEQELKTIRQGQRSDIGGRIKRGFIILSKKTGSVAMKQARLIRERQIQEAKVREKRSRGKGLTGRDNIFAPLDF